MQSDLTRAWTAWRPAPACWSWPVLGQVVDVGQTLVFSKAWFDFDFKDEPEARALRPGRGAEPVLRVNECGCSLAVCKDACCIGAYSIV